MKLRGLVTALVAAVLHPTQALAEVDPFPGVGHMQEIPGTRISSAPGMTQAQWEATDTYINCWLQVALQAPDLQYPST